MEIKLLPVRSPAHPGQKLNQPLQEALITQDRKLIYRVDDGIPVLLAEEAIASSQLSNFST